MNINLEIDGKYNDLILNALKGEITPNADVKIYKKEKKLYIEIETKSISNARAAINSFARWIDMVEKIASFIF
ncbi:MAG: KEOPS complex subunit Pcc1 [Candidatus Thermoplasmatota archaeon]